MNPDILKNYDPNAAGVTTNTIFGLPFNTHNARLVFIPVPWDVTVSNHSGTAKGPENILTNSFQIDLHDPVAPGRWQQGMAMEPIDPEIIKQNASTRLLAKEVIHFLEKGGDPAKDSGISSKIYKINESCNELMSSVEHKALQYLENGQLPVIVGGDHSVTLGLIRALARNQEFGILQIDAHADLRKDYEGFTNSHASIMRNVLSVCNVSKIVQIGIREICPEEEDFMAAHPEKIKTYFDHDLHHNLYEGESWSAICDMIADSLPDNIYITFDVDGLEPACCPGTGTPVPGGLSYNQALFLLETVVRKGKRILGADLVETGTGNIDGIVSCRLLYRMAGLMIKSNE
jgi:agmatinase